jgi:AcrR family transcriptional regulator
MLAGKRHRGLRVINTMVNGLDSGNLVSTSHRPASARVSLLSRPKRKRDRAGKQKALMQAALRLFATRGYEVTTTREIAAAAGCAEGLIHRYFNGKAGLLSALIEYQTSQELTELRHISHSAADLEEEFLQLVAWEIEYLWKNRDFLRVFISRALVDPSLGRAISRAVLSSRTQAVIERLKRHQQCSALPPEDLEALAQSVGMFGLVFGFMRPMVLGQDRTRVRKVAASLASILVRGLHLPKAG